MTSNQGASEGVVVLDKVRKCYGEFVAVEQADLTIQAGEFFAMLGPSGCGKTTTLRMIAGFELPTSGRVFLEGEDVSRVPPHRRNVNTVFQQYALFPHMSVADNVAYGPRSRKIDKSVYEPRVSEMLDVVRLGEFARRRPSQLSGGQQQRVALARALVNLPSALLLDEPLAALDLKLREAMQLELKRIQREVGITFVFVTHDQGEALTMSDRIAVMSQGRIEQVGTPEEIYNSPATLFVAGFIGSANLLAGSVIGRDGDDVTVKLRSGESVIGRSGSDLSVGDEVSVMLRPERLLVIHPGDTTGDPAGAGADGRSITGTVKDLVFQGASSRLEVELDDGSVVVAQATNDAGGAVVRPGERVVLGWNPGAAYLIPGTPTVAGATSSDVDEVEASL